MPCILANLISIVNRQISMNDNFFSTQLRRLRMGMGLNGKQLAAQVGISAPYLTQLEKGLREPSGDLLNKLAIVLKTTPDMLLIGKHVMHTKKLSFQSDRNGVIPGTISIDETPAGYLQEHQQCKNCALLQVELVAVTDQLKRANAVIDCLTKKDTK